MAALFAGEGVKDDHAGIAVRNVGDTVDVDVELVEAVVVGEVVDPGEVVSVGDQTPCVSSAKYQTHSLGLG